MSFWGLGSRVQGLGCFLHRRHLEVQGQLDVGVCPVIDFGGYWNPELQLVFSELPGLHPILVLSAFTWSLREKNPVDAHIHPVCGIPGHAS